MCKGPQGRDIELVATNTGVIASSYYAGGNISAQASADNASDLSVGAAGLVFANSGRIAYTKVHYFL